MEVCQNVNRFSWTVVKTMQIIFDDKDLDDTHYDNKK